jgi:hypothetical protein
MKKELDDALCADFPLLYADRHAPMIGTAMCWGFECGDGWEPLIRRLSQKLEDLIKTGLPNAEVLVRALQVKEKYGTLRFYLTCGTDAMYKEIGFAENESATVCEYCGKPGRLTGHGWYTTLCVECCPNEPDEPDEPDEPEITEKDVTDGLT